MRINIIVFFQFIIKKSFTLSLLKSSKKLKVKMSNMNMNISIDFLITKNKSKDGLWIEKSKLKNYIIPTFTKKYLNLLSTIYEKNSNYRSWHFRLVCC